MVFNDQSNKSEIVLALTAGIPPNGNPVPNFNVAFEARGPTLAIISYTESPLNGHWLSTLRFNKR